MSLKNSYLILILLGSFSIFSESEDDVPPKAQEFREKRDEKLNAVGKSLRSLSEGIDSLKKSAQKKLKDNQTKKKKKDQQEEKEAESQE